MMNSTACLDKYLTDQTHSLKWDLQTLDGTLRFIQNDLDSYQLLSGFADIQMDWFNSTALPCALNATATSFVDQTPFNETMDKVAMKCFGKLCNDTTKVIPCNSENLDSTLFWVMLGISIVITFIMSFLERRKSCAVNCCFGRPAPIVPLNMLDDYENRKGAAFAFGLVSTYSLSVLFAAYDRLFFKSGGAIIAAWPGYLGILIKFLCSIMISQVAYPFFIFQNMRNRLVGSILGFFITVLWICLECWKISELVGTCWLKWENDGVGVQTGIIALIIDAPMYISLLLLCYKFAYTFVQTIRERGKIDHSNEEFKGSSWSWLYAIDTDWKKEFAHCYVKRLLQGKVKQEEEEETGIKKFLYKSNPYFKYPTRMLTSLFVAICGIFVTATFIVMLGYIYFVRLKDIVFSYDVIYSMQIILGITMDETNFAIQAIVIAWWVAIAIAVIVSLLAMLSSLSLYRRHSIKLRSGNRSFLPRSMQKEVEPEGLVTASMKFAGFQVGYGVFGFLILFLVSFIIMFIFISQIVFAIKYKKVTIVVGILKGVWPTVIIAVVLIILQKCVSIFCFLIDRETLAVDNRRAYHITSYFTFFFNIFIGLGSCLLRVVFGLIYGVIFLQRLQKSTLPREIESRDPGFMAYCGYILLEHQHANPILQCFSKFLTEEIPAESNKKDKESNTMLLAKSKKKQVRNRWHLYVTLLQNPSLKKYRTYNLRKKSVIASNIGKGLGSLYTGVGGDILDINNDDEKVRSTSVMD